MLEDSVRGAGEDKAARALRERQVEGRRLLDAVAAALRADADLLEEGERARIDAAVAALERAIAGTDADGIGAACEALSSASENFAGLRMNRSIRAALAGARVEDVLPGPRAAS